MQTSRRSPLRLLAAAVRVPARLAAMALCTGACYLAIALVRPFLPRRRADTWANRVFRAWSRWLARAMGMRVEVRGEPPEVPFLLVSNHLGYVDVLLLGGAAGGSFVAKKELASWPVVGSLCRAGGTVFIDRTAKRDLVRVARLVGDALEDGRGVVIFPEGTTGDGSRLLPFKPSLLEVAVREGLEVHCAAISYSTPPGQPLASEAVCWHGGAPFLPHGLRLLALPRFRARLRFGSRPVRADDRKELARRLRAGMGRLLAD